MKKFIVVSISLLASLFACAETAEDICVFREGVVVFETNADDIDSVAVVGDDVFFFAKGAKLLYRSKKSDIDSILFLAPVPVADVLDVKFNADGTAEDVSPMGNTVESYGNPQTFFSSEYGRYEVRFSDNAWAGNANRYYKVSYADNTAFQNALADGHTMETIIRCQYSGSIADAESKYFSSHQSGGTGMMISKKSGSRKNELTFLPHVGGSWRWATSGVVPEPDVYYHIVGVWNKSENKAYIYINGELKNTIATSGDFKFPSSTCYYFAIGGDPSNATTVNSSWNGDVVVARIYDNPLTMAEVKSLWARLQDMRGPKEEKMVSDVHYYTGLQVKAGKGLDIYGTGFQEGDRISFTHADDATKSFEVVCALMTGNQGVHFILPENVVSGKYRMFLSREGKTQDLGNNQLIVVDELSRGAKVIAHRGHWKAPGAAQNSRASLKAALALKECYGSETDVWLTTDGHIMVNHDASFNGVTIQSSAYGEVKDLTLSNGEKMPQLQDLLEIMAADDSGTKLIIEVKTHSSVVATCACVDSVVSAVKAMGLEDKVEYIAFSYEACQEFVRKVPTAKVAYLNGDKSPQTLHDRGITGLDYTQAKTSDAYIKDAHALGMTVNVWTIDANDQIVYTNNRDIDYITTNYPESAIKVYRHYKENR